MATTLEGKQGTISPQLFSSPDQCVYTSCFCEENVFKLCEAVFRDHPGHLADCYAVFISNEQRMVPLWMQKARRGPDQPVLWDYHVIFIHQPTQGGALQPLVYDLDSVMSFPASFSHYMSEAIQEEYSLKQQYHRKFRVIPAQVFLSTFASDRSHMKNEDGSWMQPPPSYPCIYTSDSTMNLDDFISMDSDIGVGYVLDVQGMLQRFGTH